MPAATDKTTLLTRLDTDYAKLEALLDTVPETRALAADPEGDPATIKDIVGHRAAWIDLFLGWYADGQAGKDVALPAPGYKWSDLKRFNADLRARQADMGWDAARKLLADNHHRLRAFLGSMEDAALYGGPMKGGRNAWTTGRWAEAAGPSHYRSAARTIRARLRALAKSPDPD
jgi:hypothetical protein